MAEVHSAVGVWCEDELRTELLSSLTHLSNGILFISSTSKGFSPPPLPMYNVLTTPTLHFAISGAAHRDLAPRRGGSGRGAVPVEVGTGGESGCRARCRRRGCLWGASLALYPCEPWRRGVEACVE